jgi:hypothetical protein
MAITENVNIVFTSDTKGIEDTTDELVKTGKATEQVVDKFKKINTETKKVADGFVPLRQRLREAKEELQRAEDQFGAFSAEAQAARKNAGALADELADLNRQVGLLNPEDKIKAFSNLSQGVVASFSVATGALQAFGAENEEVQKIAQKLQGALNIVQGIQSIVQLKEAYQDVKIVLGITTAAQSALTTATTAGAAATTGATTATLGFSAALSATGIGAIVLALGALVGAFIAVENSINDAAEETERFKKKIADLDAARKTFETTFNRLLDERIEKIDFEIKKAEAREEGEKRILQLEIERAKVIDETLGKAIATGRATVEGEDALIKKRQQNAQQLELLQIKLDKILETEREISKVPTKKRDQEEIKLIEERGIVDDKVTADIIDNRRLIAQTSTELFQEEIAAQEQRLEDTRNFINDSAQLFQGLYDVKRAFDEQELQDAERLRDRGVLSEEQYAARIKKIKQKQAEENKKAAIFQATLQAASAIVNALTVTPATAVPAAVALASIIGALNLAKIIATPIPKFKKGTLNVGGGSLDADGGSLAMLHPGEAVIPADRNRSYHPTLEAIYRRQISPSEINSFVKSRLGGQIPTKVDARINSKDLRGLRSPDAVTIKNADAIANKLAQQLSRYNDLRRI